MFFSQPSANLRKGNKRVHEDDEENENDEGLDGRVRLFFCLYLFFFITVLNGDPAQIQASCQTS